MLNIVLRGRSANRSTGDKFLDWITSIRNKQRSGAKKKSGVTIRSGAKIRSSTKIRFGVKCYPETRDYQEGDNMLTGAELWSGAIRWRNERNPAPSCAPEEDCVKRFPGSIKIGPMPRRGGFRGVATPISPPPDHLKKNRGDMIYICEVRKF